MKIVKILSIMLALTALTASIYAESPLDRLKKKIADNKKVEPSAAQEPVLLPAVADEGSANNTVAEAQPQDAPETGSQATTTTLTISEQVKKQMQQGNAKGAKDDGIDLGLESEDNKAIDSPDLFMKPEIRRLLGDNPRFVYNPANKPDPMVVPWVRNAAIYAELSTLAEAMIAENRIDEAKQVFSKILEMNDPQYTDLANARMVQVLSEMEAKEMAQSGDMSQENKKIELPNWVKENMSGVIVTPGKEICLIGDYMLHVGETLPNYPEVKVASISETSVSFDVKGNMFSVQIQEALSDAYQVNVQ